MDPEAEDVSYKQVHEYRYRTYTKAMLRDWRSATTLTHALLTVTHTAPGVHRRISYYELVLERPEIGVACCSLCRECSRHRPRTGEVVCLTSWPLAGSSQMGEPGGAPDGQAGGGAVRRQGDEDRPQGRRPGHRREVRPYMAHGRKGGRGVSFQAPVKIGCNHHPSQLSS
jgi:hypothetical protein